MISSPVMGQFEIGRTKVRISLFAFSPAAQNAECPAAR